MNLQEAMDAPTVNSVHFPSSFHPREGFPARMYAEGRLSPQVVEELQRRGHEVEVRGDWVHGKVMAVQIDAKHGTMLGAASPKNNISYAMGW
jgi:gamma-glutamyltranspeptidase/glutathione hydrolase